MTAMLLTLWLVFTIWFMLCLVIMATVKADVTAWHKWPTKTTNKEHPMHKTNTIFVLLNWFVRFCLPILIYKMCKLLKYIFQSVLISMSLQSLFIVQLSWECACRDISWLIMLSTFTSQETFWVFSLWLRPYLAAFISGLNLLNVELSPNTFHLVSHDVGHVTRP